MGRRRHALALLFVVLVSCRAPRAARPAARPPSPDALVTAQEFVGPGGVPVQMACTPTGPELCFDATDNNCNGVIDEGCGVETGALQFAIAWQEGADVDLEVTDPRGEMAKIGEHAGAGLTKDRDCGRPQSVCHGQNMENVHFVGDRPPAGRYKVEIKVDKPDDVRFPLKVRFGGRVGIKTFSLDVLLDAPEDSKTFAFTLP